MRAVSITIVAAFVALLGLQLTAASRGPDLEEHGFSQAVVSGAIKCFPQDFPQESSTIVSLEIGGGLGVIGLPFTENGRNFSVFADATAAGKDCSELIPILSEQIPHPICEIGSTLEFEAGARLDVLFACTGRADTVVSAVGTMAKAVNRAGQP
jgi:hypothetical protein